MDNGSPLHILGAQNYIWQRYDIYKMYIVQGLWKT